MAPSRFTILFFVALSTLGTGATPGVAQPCSLRQVTSTTPGEGGLVVNQSLSLSTSGEYLTFEGTAQGGPSLIDVWSYEVLTDTLDRVTIGQTTDNTSPEYSGDGTIVAFRESEDFVGNNADLNSEVFVWDRLADSLTQVTDTTGTIIGGIQLAASPQGDFIVFSHTKELAGSPNPDNNSELYRWNRGDGTFQRLTNSPEDSTASAINPSSSMVVFRSEGNFAGSNPDLNHELFQVDLATLVIEQLTDTTGCNNFLASGGNVFAADSTLLSFASDCSFDGLNPEGNREAFVLNLVTEDIEQVSPSGSNDASSGTFTEDGRWIGLSFSDDPTGSNPDGSVEAFLYDRSTGNYIQLTDSSDPTEVATPPLTNDDLSIIAFTHRYDPLGTNADREREVFVCLGLGSSVVEVPALGPGGLAVLGILLALLGVAVVKVR